MQVYVATADLDTTLARISDLGTRPLVRLCPLLCLPCYGLRTMSWHLCNHLACVSVLLQMSMWPGFRVRNCELCGFQRIGDTVLACCGRW